MSGNNEARLTASLQLTEVRANQVCGHHVLGPARFEWRLEVSCDGTKHSELSFHRTGSQMVTRPSVFSKKVNNKSVTNSIKKRRQFKTAGETI